MYENSIFWRAIGLAPHYRRGPNKQTMCYVVRSFLLWKSGQKSAPQTNKKRKRKKRYLTKRSNSNVLAQGPFIRVVTVFSSLVCDEPLKDQAYSFNRTQDETGRVIFGRQKREPLILGPTSGYPSQYLGQVGIVVTVASNKASKFQYIPLARQVTITTNSPSADHREHR